MVLARLLVRPSWIPSWAPAMGLAPSLCLLLGCGGGAERAPLRVPEPVVQPAARGVPITLAELPALSDDGRLVAVSMLLAGGRLSDAHRALGLVDVETDRLVRRAPLHDMGDPAATPRLEAAAEKLLAAHRWVRLLPYEVAEDPDAPLRQGGVGAPFRNNLAVGEGLVVRYREPELVVRDGSPGELFHDAMRSYSIGPNRPKPGWTQCDGYLANLKAAYGARAEGVLLLVIDYHGGSDSCPEPEDGHHVVQVPRSR